ncbi:MAG: hypothetical protein D6714_18855, partial [Bacteroidetes bacterium]
GCFWEKMKGSVVLGRRPQVLSFPTLPERVSFKCKRVLRNHRKVTFSNETAPRNHRKGTPCKAPARAQSRDSFFPKKISPAQRVTV